MIVGGAQPDQGDADEEQDIGPGVGRPDENGAPFLAGYHEDPKETYRGEPCVRYNIVEIGDAEKRPGVGKQMVAQILGDRVQGEEAGEADDQQADHDRDAPHE